MDSQNVDTLSFLQQANLPRTSHRVSGSKHSPPPTPPPTPTPLLQERGLHSQTGSNRRPPQLLYKNSLPFPGGRPIEKPDPSNRESLLLPPDHNAWEGLRYNAFTGPHARSFQCLLVILVSLLTDIEINKDVLQQLFESHKAGSKERYSVLACVSELAAYPHKSDVSRFTAEELQKFLSPIADNDPGLHHNAFRFDDFHKIDVVFTQLDLGYDLDSVLEYRSQLYWILPHKCIHNAQIRNIESTHDKQLDQAAATVQDILGPGVDNRFIQIIALKRCRKYQDLQNWSQTLEADELIRSTERMFSQLSRSQRMASLLVSYLAHQHLFGILPPHPGDRIQTRLPGYMHRDGYISVYEALRAYVQLSEDGNKIRQLIPDLNIPPLAPDRLRQWKLIVGDKHSEICAPDMELSKPRMTEEKKSAVVLFGAFVSYHTFIDLLCRYFDVNSESTTDRSRETRSLAEKNDLALFYYDGQSPATKNSIEDTMNDMRRAAQANSKTLTIVLETDRYRKAQPSCDAQQIVKNTSCQHLQLSLDRLVQEQGARQCKLWISSPPQHPGAESKLDTPRETVDKVIHRSTQSQENKRWWNDWKRVMAACVRRASK